MINGSRAFGRGAGKRSAAYSGRVAGGGTVLGAALLVLFLPLAAYDAEPPPAEEPAALPERLSEAGLFVPGSAREVRPQLLPFSPQYPLWSDGTKKRRWIELPPGATIDASDANAWDFPPGTRLFKEFSLDRPVETRLIERLSDGTWRYATYVFGDDGGDAVLAPEDGIAALPVAGAPGGRYAIPSEYDCRACHEGARVPVLGFSALQLSPDRDPLAPHADTDSGVTLRELFERGLLRDLPRTLRESPPRIAAASPTERAVLGYLHGNCGHCHGASAEDGAAVPVDVRLFQAAADPDGSAAVLRSLIHAPSRYRPAGERGPAQVVAPGRADLSVLPLRMRSRDPRVQMPPLGTALPDFEALALIERWISEQPQLQSQPAIQESRR